MMRLTGFRGVFIGFIGFQGFVGFRVHRVSRLGCVILP